MFWQRIRFDPIIPSDSRSVPHGESGIHYRLWNDPDGCMRSGVLVPTAFGERVRMKMSNIDGRRAGRGNRVGSGGVQAALLICAVALTACQAAPAGPGAVATSSKSAALRTMEQVAINAHKCWFASNDPAFRSYSFANELNSFSGRPRFLLVPKSNFGGKPMLVVQAEGEPARVDAFGPLMDQPVGTRVSADLKRWIGGSASCTQTA